MDGQLPRDYGRLRGLIRRENSTTGGSRFCFVNGDLADGWIQDTSLLRHWVDPGSEVLAEVDRAQASRLAADLGVPGLDLDGEPVAVDRDGDGVLSSATESPQDDAINEGESTTMTGLDTGPPGDEPAALGCDERGQRVRGGGRGRSLEPSVHSETLAALKASPYARVSVESGGDTQIMPLSGKALQAVKAALGKSSSDPSARIRVELHTHEGVVGEITLSSGGVAVGSNGIARKMMEDTKIVQPGRPPTLLKPSDGERYIRALPVNLHGSRFWAELVEENEAERPYPDEQGTTTRRFYRYNLDGQLDGLVRREQPDLGGQRFAYVGDSAWVADGSILRQFIDPGDIDLVEIDEAEARRVASEFGVTLDGEPTSETALGDRPGID